MESSSHLLRKGQHGIFVQLNIGDNFHCCGNGKLYVKTSPELAECKADGEIGLVEQFGTTDPIICESESNSFGPSTSVEAL